MQLRSKGLDAQRGTQTRYLALVALYHEILDSVLFIIFPLLLFKVGQHESEPVSQRRGVDAENEGEAFDCGSMEGPRRIQPHRWQS